MMDNYRAEVMRRNNFTTDEQYKKWVFEGDSLPDEELDWATERLRGH
jgi:hypothetical protein